MASSTGFTQEIGQLRGLIAEMGGLAEVAIRDAIDSLTRHDLVLAQTVVAGDAKIDALEAEVDRLAVRVIALRAPMADDLRDVIAALKISGVVERIGDYAKNIAKRVGKIETINKFQPLTLIPAMATIAQGMARRCWEVLLLLLLLMLLMLTSVWSSLLQYTCNPPISTRACH